MENFEQIFLMPHNFWPLWELHGDSRGLTALKHGAVACSFMEPEVRARMLPRVIISKWENKK